MKINMNLDINKFLNLLPSLSDLKLRLDSVIQRITLNFNNNNRISPKEAIQELTSIQEEMKDTKASIKSITYPHTNKENLNLRLNSVIQKMTIDSKNRISSTDLIQELKQIQSEL